MNKKPGSRTVIVTGGAYGIGRAIVRRFARHGDAVLVADLNAGRGQLVEKDLQADGLEVAFLQVDLREAGSVEDMIQHAIHRWGRIDVVCNNAGIEINRRADEFTLDDWSAMQDTNLRAAFLSSKHAFPFLKESGGCIVNTASVQGLACEANTAVYASTKAGLLALTRGMAIDFGPHGVRVNAICPGAVHTGMMESYLQSQPDQESALQGLSRNIPLGRIGQPEEIAGVAWFLASPDAAYISGASLVVDGGLLAKLAT